MMKKSVSAIMLVALVLLLNTASAYAGWTKALGSRTTHNNSVTVDVYDNTYVAGDTFGALATKTSAGGQDLIIAKYNSVGTLMWTRQTGTEFDDTATGVACDTIGSVYVTGNTLGGLDGNANLGDADVFITKYSNTGVWQWTRQTGTSSWDWALGIAVGSDGSVYAVGYTFDSFAGCSNAGDADIFIVKYNSSGDWQWTREIGTENFDSANGVAVGPDNSVYITGDTGGGLEGNNPLGFGDCFLAKYNSAGTLQWVQLAGSDSGDWGTGVAVDSDSNIYITGQTYGTFDGHDYHEGEDFFIAKYNSGGTIQWSRQMGTPLDDASNGIAVGSDGYIYITGLTAGNLDGVTNQGDYDIFLSKFNSAGTILWTRLSGTTIYDWAAGVSTGSNGSVSIAGFKGLAAFTMNLDGRVPPTSSITQLTSNKSNIEQAGTSITWTATAYGGSHTKEYQFWLNGPSTGNVWAVTRGYSSSASWTWNTTSANMGSNNVRVYVRSAGNTSAYEGSMVSAQPTTIVDSPASVSTLTCNTSYSVTSGDAVTWTATATGGSGNYLYEFWLYSPSNGNTWTVARSYSSSNTWTWTTSNADAGSNRVMVHVKNTNSPAEYDGAMTSDQPTIVGYQPAAVYSLVCDKAFTVAAGTSIKWTATATGGSGVYEYEFWLYGPETGNVWTVKRAYSTVDNWTWNSAIPDIGSNRIRVYVRNYGQSNAYDSQMQSSQITTITTPPVASATLVADKPNLVYYNGTAMKWTATGSGGMGSYQYEFWQYGPATGNVWTIKRAYSNVNNWTWNMVLADVGSNRVKVNVRNAGATNAYDVTLLSSSIITVTSTPVSSIGSLTSNLMSTSVGGSPIVWTATGTGGSGSYDYQFSVNGPGTGNVWSIKRTYSTTATWSWSPSASDVGSSRIKVDVRTTGSGRTSDAVKLSDFLANVNPSTTPVTTTINSPLHGATISGNSHPIQITASSANGITSVQARFNNTAYVTCTYNSGTGKWEGTLDSTGFANGTVQFSAIATDSLGNIKIDTIQPILSN